MFFCLFYVNFALKKSLKYTTMKLKFTIPYITNWGESLHICLRYCSRDGYYHDENLLMNTGNGEVWYYEGVGHQNRQHPYTGIIYYYQVEDSEGEVLRRESLSSPRAYGYDDTRNYNFADFWLDEEKNPMEVVEDTEEKLPDADMVLKNVEVPQLPLYQQTILFKVSAPKLHKDEAIAVVGSHPTLGAWNPNRYLKMVPVGNCNWVLSVNVQAIDRPLEYKYIVIDESEQDFKRWEWGENRTLEGERVLDNDVLVLHGGNFRIKKMPPHAQFNFDTYIFDLDGTLLSTLKDLAASCNYALQLNGMPERTLEEVRMFVGNGVKKLMERAVPGGTGNPSFEKTLGDFRQHYMLHNMDSTKPYPGIIEMLKELKERGKNIAVVSNKFYNATQALCRHFFGSLVDVAIGEREDIKKKPAPDTVNEALRQLGADRRKAVYIGDSDVDVATARNCEMPCISVLWGFRDRDFLIEHDATIFVSTPEQIL